MEYFLNLFGLVDGQKRDVIKHIEIINKMKLIIQRESMKSKKQVDRLKNELYNMIKSGKNDNDIEVVRKARLLTRNVRISGNLEKTYNALCIIGDDINTNSRNINIIKKLDEFTPVLEEINESIKIPQIIQISKNLQKGLEKLNNKTEMIDDLMENIDDQSAEQEDQDISDETIKSVIEEINKEFEMRMAENKASKHKSKKREAYKKQKEKNHELSVPSNKGSSSNNPKEDDDDDD